MEIQVWLTMFRVLAARRAVLVANERGMTTEAVLITAGLAALAITVLAVIVAKVTQKADSISTDTP